MTYDTANTDVTIYGDSIMKGTVMDGSCRYHATCNSYISKLASKFNMDFINRARFGSTIEKGFQALKNDLAAKKISRYTLIEFGGNDCNFDWDRISEMPDAVHEPYTPLDRFTEIYCNMVELIREHRSVPVGVTLPPIDCERYLSFICRNGNSRDNILKWLGGTAKTIFKYHQSYSDAIEKLTKSLGVKLIDIRNEFIAYGDTSRLLCLDGIHPNESGYALIYGAFNRLLSRK